MPDLNPLPSFIIPGIDTQLGIAMTGGTEAGYRTVLSMFHKDAEDRLHLLRTTPDTEALPAFVTQVHALKSASASIGAIEVSAEAARLETAGKEGNLAFIGNHLPIFAKQLSELTENIRIALVSLNTGGTQNEQQNGTPLPEPSNASVSTSLLRELEAALKSQKADIIDNILDELNKKQLDAKTKDALEQLSDEVLMAEYDGALKILNNLFTSTKDVHKRAT